MTDNIDKLLISTLNNLNESINESNKIYKELNNSINFLNDSIKSMKLPQSKQIESVNVNNNNIISNKPPVKLLYNSNYKNKYENINNFLNKWIYLRRKLFRFKLKNFINNFKNLKLNYNYGLKTNNIINTLLDNLISYDNINENNSNINEMPGKLLMTHMIKFLTNCAENEVILDQENVGETIVNSDMISDIESKLSKEIPEEYNQKLEILQIFKDYYKLQKPELSPIISESKKKKLNKKFNQKSIELKNNDLNLINSTSSRNNSVIDIGDITSDSYNISNISLISEIEIEDQEDNVNIHKVNSIHSEYSEYSQISEFSEINNSNITNGVNNNNNNQGTDSSICLKSSKSDISLLNGLIEEQQQASNKLRHKTSGLLNLTIQLFESSNKNKNKNKSNKNMNMNNSKIRSNGNSLQEFEESFQETNDEITSVTSTMISGDIIPDVIKQDELILIAAVSTSITRDKYSLFDYRDIQEYKEFFGSKIEGMGYLIIDKRRNAKIQNKHQESDKEIKEINDGDKSDDEIRILTYYIPTCDKAVISDKYLNAISSLNKLKVVNDSNYISAQNIKIPLTVD